MICGISSVKGAVALHVDVVYFGIDWMAVIVQNHHDYTHSRFPMP